MVCFRMPNAVCMFLRTPRIEVTLSPIYFCFVASAKPLSCRVKFGGCCCCWLLLGRKQRKWVEMKMQMRKNVCRAEGSSSLLPASRPPRPLSFWILPVAFPVKELNINSTPRENGGAGYYMGVGFHNLYALINTWGCPVSDCCTCSSSWLTARGRRGGRGCWEAARTIVLGMHVVFSEEKPVGRTVVLLLLFLRACMPHHVVVLVV